MTCFDAFWHYFKKLIRLLGWDTWPQSSPPYGYVSVSISAMAGAIWSYG